jgi:hypothetical protein
MIISPPMVVCAVTAGRAAVGGDGDAGCLGDPGQGLSSAAG